jgi:hypothetical protein
MNTSWTACRWLAVWLTLALATASAWAVDPPQAPHWVLTQDGAYAINLHDKLAWPRCVEGMNWDGKTCIGKPVLLTYAQAMALAATRKKADGVDWRLPSVTELQRLLNKSTNPPGMDSALFPNALRDWHWAGTASVNAAPVNQYNYGNIVQGRTADNANQLTVLKGWTVNLMTGEARDATKRSRLAVRLVASQD